MNFLIIMSPSIGEMASKGAAKLSRKSGQMAASYNASKGRAKQNYAAVGFGPARQSAYSAGIDAAVYHAPSPEKWSRNWTAKMQE